MPEIGEEFIETCGRYYKDCDFVDYNVGVMGGPGEIDVVWVNLDEGRAKGFAGPRFDVNRFHIGSSLANVATPSNGA